MLSTEVFLGGRPVVSNKLGAAGGPMGKMRWRLLVTLEIHFQGVTGKPSFSRLSPWPLRMWRCQC